MSLLETLLALTITAGLFVGIAQSVQSTAVNAASFKQYVREAGEATAGLVGMRKMCLSDCTQIDAITATAVTLRTTGGAPRSLFLRSGQLIAQESGVDTVVMFGIQAVRFRLLSGVVGSDRGAVLRTEVTLTGKRGTQVQFMDHFVGAAL